MVIEGRHGSGVVFAGRYAVGSRIGRGGSGEVYAGRDLRRDEPVAVKLMSPETDAARGRLVREIASLRAVDDPRVVRLRDWGTTGDQTWLAMDFVDGRHFPGAVVTRDWAAIEPTVVALLEALAAVHAAGLTHRDLKPANVLVDDDGRPTVVDFGLARTVLGGDTVTRDGLIAGTPAYLAPEQIVGERCDARTDLFAIGAMLFEHVSGVLPHGADDPLVMMRRRLLARAAPVASLAPEIPGHVALVIDRLLANAPERRPASAGEVIAALRGARTFDAPLPWLGDRAPIEAVIAALRERRAIDIAGPSGAGCTRCLREALAAVADASPTVHWLAVGKRPFESLRALVPADRIASPAPRDVPAIVEAAIAERLDRGEVIVADAAAQLDRWSTALLDRTRSLGAVLRVVDDPAAADVKLAPLSPGDLRAIIEGPDRILHLQEDGSRLLYTRTGGNPRDVSREIVAWIGAGHAEWTKGRLRLTRVALRTLESTPIAAMAATDGPTVDELDGALAERLAWIALAWPASSVELIAIADERAEWEVEMEVDQLVALEAVRRRPDGRLEPRVPAYALHWWTGDDRTGAQRALVAALPSGTDGRLAHLLAVGGADEIADEIADEALTRGRALYEAGELDRALGLYRHTLAAMRTTGDDDEASYRVLSAYIETACREIRPDALDDLDRRLIGGADDDRLRRLRTLVGAARTAASKATARASIESAEALGPFDSPQLECARMQALVTASMHAPDLDYLVTCLRRAEAWVHQEDSWLRARYFGWLGQLRYLEGRFEDSAEMQEKAASHAGDGTSGVSARINAAIARLDALQPHRARALALEARADARRLRSTGLESYAEVLLRGADYRLGKARVPDRELMTAVGATGNTWLASMAGLTEAAVAWRSGDDGLAADLTRDTLRGWTQTSPPLQTLLARAFAFALDASEGESVEALVEAAANCPWPRLAIQVIGLAIWRQPGQLAFARRVAEALARPVSEQDRRHRLEVLSIEESLAGRFTS